VRHTSSRLFDAGQTLRMVQIGTQAYRATPGPLRVRHRATVTRPLLPRTCQRHRAAVAPPRVKRGACPVPAPTPSAVRPVTVTMPAAVNEAIAWPIASLSSRLLLSLRCELYSQHYIGDAEAGTVT
jgi:hypothetical protein